MSIKGKSIIGGKITKITQLRIAVKEQMIVLNWQQITYLL